MALTRQALADIAAGRTDQAEARLALAKTPPVVRVSPDPPHVPADCRQLARCILLLSNTEEVDSCPEHCAPYASGWRWSL